MKPLERARFIRDVILAVPRDKWAWREFGSHRFLTLTTSEWEATLMTAFGTLRTRPEATTYQQAAILQAAPADLPNVLELYSPGRGKLLSFEYDDDQIRLISMRRGSWESELFGLPEYQPKTKT
jgi:hypothetical protein